MTWRTLAPRAATPATQPDALPAALDAAAELREFLRAAATADEPVLLLVNDAHRATPTRPVLAWLGQRFGAIRASAIVATGTHRFRSDERAAFERETFAECGLTMQRVHWHDAASAIDDVELAGARLNRALFEHRFLLPIGSVEPHYFAGLTGAHKTLTIGVMARADIERNHAGALHPASDVFELDGNPVHDGIAAVVRGLHEAGKRICAVNQVLQGGRAIAVAVGDPLDTLHTLRPRARDVFLHEIQRPVDLLHLCVSMPLARNFYQADKALKNNHRAVRDGGGIILEAECPEGIGPDHFMRLLRLAPDYASARLRVEADGYRLGDHKAVKLRHLTDPAQRGVHVALVSRHVSAEDAAIAGMRSFHDAPAARRWLQGVMAGRVETGCRVEDAGNVVARPVESSKANPPGG